MFTESRGTSRHVFGSFTSSPTYGTHKYSAAPPSTLASARMIADLNTVPYPENIKIPNPTLTFAVTPGKFRYERDFLLQFMDVCKDKPDSLPALDALGLEPGERGAGYSASARAGGRRLGLMNNAPSLQRQASIGLGLGPGLANRGGFAMGSFQSPSNSQSRFDASSVGVPFTGGGGSRLTPMSRSAGQGGVSDGTRKPKRTRSQRGRNRDDSIGTSGLQTASDQQTEEHQLVNLKVKALLNKLTIEAFDLISDQIIEWANQSEQETDGSTLMQVIKLVFETAKDEPEFGEMYARLCRKMMERVSPNVQDETIRNSEGQPITGGMLFRKYLLNRCQEDFERGWSAKEAAFAAVASKAGEDNVAEAGSEGNGEVVACSDEYYVVAKAKRQGLGLVRFIGELFKIRMLTERIMDECIKKLLVNVANPEEEEIESLCELLKTVGRSLDNPKARNHMDIYFERMQEMAKGNNINSRMQFMLQDMIELRARHWQAHSAVSRPPPTHQGSRDNFGRYGITHGGSQRGEHRGNDFSEPDGWNVISGVGTSRPSARPGDLSQFGKIAKTIGIQFGPSSVFGKKDTSKQDLGIGRVDMFSALSTGAAGSPHMKHILNSRNPSANIRPSLSLGASGTGEKKRLNLFPRFAQIQMSVENTLITEENVQNKVKEDVKEYLAVEKVDDAIMALEALPSEHRHLLVDKLVNSSMDGGNKVVTLTEKLFAAARTWGIISSESFQRGFLPIIEMADDLSIDVPKTYEWLARMMHAAGMDRSQIEDMAGKISVYGEPRVPPRQLLIKAFEEASISSPLNANAPTFIPPGLRQEANLVCINNNAVKFEDQTASPEVTTPIPPKQQVAVNIIETERQKNARLAREEEEQAERNRWGLEGPESLANYDRFIAIARRRVRENIVY